MRAQEMSAVYDSVADEAIRETSYFWLSHRLLTKDLTSIGIKPSYFSERYCASVVAEAEAEGKFAPNQVGSASPNAEPKGASSDSDNNARRCSGGTASNRDT